MSFVVSSLPNHQPQLLKLARVTDPIIPQWEGSVFFEGTYWKARFYDPDCQVTLYPGQKVQVIAREGLKLLVSPVNMAVNSFYLNQTKTAATQSLVSHFGLNHLKKLRELMFSKQVIRQ